MEWSDKPSEGDIGDNRSHLSVSSLVRARERARKTIALIINQLRYVHTCMYACIVCTYIHVVLLRYKPLFASSFSLYLARSPIFLSLSFSFQMFVDRIFVSVLLFAAVIAFRVTRWRNWENYVRVEQAAIKGVSLSGRDGSSDNVPEISQDRRIVPWDVAPRSRGRRAASLSQFCVDKFALGRDNLANNRFCCCYFLSHVRYVRFTSAFPLSNYIVALAG